MAYLTKQVLEGLCYLHGQGIVHGCEHSLPFSCLTFELHFHRDLKPTSILLKVDDFGIGADWGSLDMHNVTVKIGGLDAFGRTNQHFGRDPTRHVPTRLDKYMPPEMFDGHGASMAGDIYSIGIIVFELLLHRTPSIKEGMQTCALIRPCKGIFHKSSWYTLYHTHQYTELSEKALIW